jgi:hypothetical protein
MADNSAEAATAVAGSERGSAPGLAMSEGSAAAAAPELNDDASFDVESFLAGDADGADDAGAGSGDGAFEGNDDGEGSAADDAADAGDGDEPDDAVADDDAGDADEGDDAGDGEEPEDAELLRALKPKAQKRFNQLLKQRDEALAARREAEKERDELKVQVESGADAPVPVVLRDDPLAAVVNEEQLDAHANFYQRVKSWCRRNPDGGVPPRDLTGGVETDLDRDAVIDNLETAETMLEAVPRRREFLARFREMSRGAREYLPEAFKKGTAEHKRALEIQRALFEFGRRPDQALIVARLVKLERMEREEREGVARYPRIEVKPVAKEKVNGGANGSAKRAPLPRAVPTVRPTAGAGASARPWERVNAKEAVDAEDLLEAL